MNIFKIAFSLFLIANPIGNIPPILSVVRAFSFETQRKILIREALFSFLIAIFFQFVGESFLTTLELAPYTLSFCGGILLFIVALDMIFPHPQVVDNALSLEEPFIVPIATPLITGAGVMSAIMLYSSKPDVPFYEVTLAIILAWVAVSGVTIGAPYIQKVLGKRGIAIMEQLMGMLLAMVSIGLMVNGVKQFLKV